MEDRHAKPIWCDGLLPEQYYLEDDNPRIVGTAFMCKSPNEWYERWEFTLFLSKTYNSRDDIEWEALLPPENVTRWLAYDRFNQKIQFEPSAAENDPPC